MNPEATGFLLAFTQPRQLQNALYGCAHRARTMKKAHEN